MLLIILFMIGPNIEIDCHFTTSFANTNDQLQDAFIKSLIGPRVSYLCNKVGAYDLYALVAWVLKID